MILKFFLNRLIIRNIVKHLQNNYNPYKQSNQIFIIFLIILIISAKLILPDWHTFITQRN